MVDALKKKQAITSNALRFMGTFRLFDLWDPSA